MSPGDRYGGYEIVEFLGRGNMGWVYLARHSDGQQVALKIVYRGQDLDDADVLEAEQLGAELQQRLRGVDPRVVGVNRYGYFGRDLFIEMEYVPGEDLATTLQRGPLNPRLAAGIAMQLCEMLENLRTFSTSISDKQFTGVVHGDLKPRNIRITPEGHVKVIDFGIAKALSQTRKQTVNVFASKAYCSPERLDTQNMDSHSDLWSAGVLLYQMIAGKLPFNEASVEQLERRIRSGPPANPLPASCPESLRNIVMRMLARDPARRYQTATDVKQDLTRFLKGERVGAMPVESEATVRTSLRTAPPLVRKTASPILRRTFGCFAILGALALVAVTAVGMQVSFYDDASAFKEGVETKRIDLDDAWARYQKLNRREHLPFLMWGARRALKSRLIAAGSEPILEYRNSDAPTVRENQWKQAYAEFARAEEIDPDDNKIRGDMDLCEGHLDRIAASGTKGANRAKNLNAAVSKFHESADLLRKSPDPYLGLARLYVYDLNDMERAEDALNKAWDYGHARGKREKAQLADGYYHRAERTVSAARSFSEMPQQQREYLEKSRQDYLHAEDLYAQVGAFYNATQNRIKAIRAADQVENRIRELQDAGFVK
ncbi:MAG: serine/threonine protein kinase [Acidobacteriota bacterium]|nr:serine/threonine protein kinase [Acidobacteriota bacterium]